MAAVPLDTVMSRIGTGWFQIRLWWISGLGFSAAAVEVVMMSFVFPELRDGPWNLNEYELGALVTVIGCGSVVGTPLFGYLADMYGRRPVFIGTVLIVVVFGVASAFASNIYMLAGLRFFVGFGYGGNIAVDFSLYSEFLPTEGRGKMLFMLTAFWPVGQVLTAVLAWYVIPALGWRPFIALCALPSLVTSFFRPYIPESPRWLLTQNRHQEATEVCVQMAETNGKSVEEVGLGGLAQVCLENEASSLDGGRLATDLQRQCSPFSTSKCAGLITGKMRTTTLGLVIMVVGLNYTGYGTQTMMPSILQMKGIEKADMYEQMILISLAQLPGVIGATLVATHCGRLIPLRISLVLAGVALIGFALAQKQSHVLACTMLASCFLEAGWAVYHVYVPEVYPTDCRASATGLLSACGSVIAMIGPMVSAKLLDAESPFRAILAFSSCALFAGISSWFLLHIETQDRDLNDFSAACSDGKSKTVD